MSISLTGLMYIFFTLPIYITFLLSVIGTAVTAGGCVIVIILLVIFHHLKLIQIKRINLRNLNIELASPSSPAVTEASLIFRSSSEPLLISPARQTIPTQPMPSTSATSPVTPKRKPTAPKAKAPIPRQKLLREQMGPYNMRNKKK